MTPKKKVPLPLVNRPRGNAILHGGFVWSARVRVPLNCPSASVPKSLRLHPATSMRVEEKKKKLGSRRPNSGWINSRREGRVQDKSREFFTLRLAAGRAHFLRNFMARVSRLDFHRCTLYHSFDADSAIAFMAEGSFCIDCWGRYRLLMYRRA